MQKISTISEYTQIIEENYKKVNSSEREVLAFRGQSSVNYKLTPYLERYGVKKEREIIQLAKTSYPTTFKENFSPLVLLSLLQHYGIPTRLLDITQNALVGLYFACNENSNSDGKVYVFNYKEKPPEDTAVENVIADTYHIMHPSAQEMPLTSFCQSAEKLHEENFSWLNENITEYLQRKMRHIYFVRLPHLIYRQTVQSGNYILFSNAIRNEKIISKIDPIPEDDSSILDKIIIERSAKKTIMAELEYFGITEMQLFPENIDKGCKWLRAKLS